VAVIEVVFGKQEIFENPIDSTFMLK